jgi:hypothetical protein
MVLNNEDTCSSEIHRQQIPTHYMHVLFLKYYFYYCQKLSEVVGDLRDTILNLTESVLNCMLESQVTTVNLLPFSTLQTARKHNQYD